MKHFILFFLFLLTLSGAAQIPNPFHKNVEGLAKKFKKDYPDDSTRVVAIYDWISHYMHYDYKAFKKYKFSVNNYSMGRVLYRRKALCHGFSKLFQDLCLRSGVKCAQLQGYTFENPDDPYIHYYYQDHAWNIALLNGHWYLFDVTNDNGYLKKKKRTIRKILNKTLAIPVLYNKTKFVHRPTNKYSFQSGSHFIDSHYPIVINALLISDKVSIESFEAKDIRIWGSYNPSSYPDMAQLIDFAATNQAIQLKTAADQSLLFNRKNNFIKSTNYYQSLFHHRKIREDFNKSDVDTVLKYGALFKRDNAFIHAKNNKRIDEEHKKLSDPLKKVSSHNGRLMAQYNKKGIKAILKLAKTTEANAINAHKIEERQMKLEEHQAGSREKYDTIAFSLHLEEYQNVSRKGDSLLLNLNHSNRLLDSLNTRSEELFNTLYSLLKERQLLLEAHKGGDLYVATYPALKPTSAAIDSLTSLFDRYKIQIDKTESEYNKCRQLAIRTANTGFTLTSKEYVKMQTGISVRKPFSKDSLVTALLYRCDAFKETLVDLYHHDEELLHRHTTQYFSVAKFLKKEKKLIKKTIEARDMAYYSRIMHEMDRYLAYDNIVSTMMDHMRILKMKFKRKTSVKKK